MRIDAPLIKSWVERIERLLAERDAINGGIKDIYAEVKSHEHDGKALRKLIQRRAQDAGTLAEQDALLAAYTDAIAGKIRALEAIDAGASTEEAAKAGGISTGAVSALRQGRPRVQKSRKLNEPPHDPTTGEIIEKAGPDYPAAEEQAPVGNDTAGSSSANPLEGGPFPAAADCRVSPEPAAQAVNADPLSGRVSPTATCGKGSEVGAIPNSKENDDGRSEDFGDGGGSGAPKVQPERQGRGVGDQAADGNAGEYAGADRPAQRQDGDRRRDGGDPARPDGQHVGGVRGDQGAAMNRSQRRRLARRRSLGIYLSGGLQANPFSEVTL